MPERDDKQYIWDPDICPLCERNLRQAAKTLGFTPDEARRYHAEVHRQEIIKYVLQLASSRYALDLSRLDDWIKEEW